jgi:hypothetical protein
MAKTEVVSLLIAFFYAVLGISLSSITNFFLAPTPDMASVASSMFTNPMGGLMAILNVYFGSIFPIGPGLIILIILIAVALIIALFANEKVALGLIGASKILLLYLGITLAFIFMMEGMILKSASLYSAEPAFPLMGVVILISSIIGFIIFFALAFIVGKPKRKTIFADN